MVDIIYVEPSGNRRTVEVNPGWSLMQGATANGVDGIIGECGGSCSCGTCHCYIDEAGLAKLQPPGAGESDTLDTVAAELKANSRLSCQIIATAELSGLVVIIPETQG